MLFQILSVLTALSFLYYGAACMMSSSMKAEFERFGVPRLRIVIGILELMGGVGLLVGIAVPVLGFLAATGISLLMAIVVVQRIQQGATWVQMAQAALFAGISLWLALFGFLQL